MKKEIKVFESKTIRSSWDTELEKWYFSIVDVIEILTDSPRPRKYWNASKTKLHAEGSELSQNVGQLKLKSEDGKFYKTDVAKATTTEISQQRNRTTFESNQKTEIDYFLKKIKVLVITL